MTHTLERDTAAVTPDAGSHPFVDTTHDTPQPPAATPAAKRGFGGSARNWRNRAIALLMVGAAGYGTVQLIQHQSAASEQLAVDDVVLTTQPIDVTLPQTGLVTAVAVHAGDRVTNGQPVGSVAVTTTDSQGHAVVVDQALVAPSDGIVVTDPLAVGNTLLPGSNFLEMYDPNALQLKTDVPLSTLSKVGTGMTAVLTAPGVPGTVKASLQRAVPRVGTEQTAVPKGDVQLVLTPKDPKSIATLLPGLRFQGYIDTATGTSGSTRALYVGTSR